MTAATGVSGLTDQGQLTEGTQGIPSSLLSTLQRVLPLDSGITLLVRHAHRNDIPKEGVDNVLLTDEGKSAAAALGELLHSRHPYALISSTKERCFETLVELCRGAGWDNSKIERDGFYAPSGPFMIDLDLATEQFSKLGGLGLFNAQIANQGPVPGMRDTKEGIKELFQKIFSNPPGKGEISVITTHDAVTTVILGYLFDCTFSDQNWPAFLDGALFWEEAIYYKVAWRGEVREFPKTF